MCGYVYMRKLNDDSTCLSRFAMCVGVCVCVRERERESVCVCKRERKRERVCV